MVEEHEWGGEYSPYERAREEGDYNVDIKGPFQAPMKS